MCEMDKRRKGRFVKLGKSDREIEEESDRIERVQEQPKRELHGKRDEAKEREAKCDTQREP